MKFFFFKFISIFLLLFTQVAISQNVTLEAYVYEANNRGFLNEVRITVLRLPIKAIAAKDIYSDVNGKFVVDLKAGHKYLVRAEKDIFQTKEIEISTEGKVEGEKVFGKMEMNRKPGYLFEATLAEKRTDPDQVVDAISGSLIEIYNNTTDEEVLVLENHEPHSFSYTFEQGNHYTVMIRKEGYLAKRIEAYVNINGCIVCIDGVRQAGPGIVDNLTHGFQMGTLLANIELDRADLNSTISVDNIYYDLAKWDIREEAEKELDKVIVLMNDNPDIIVELGSHSDSRGGDSYNLELSEKRATAAVEYITSTGKITTDRIQAKGYGESELINKCANGVKCSERRHQQNRRTELKIVGFKPKKRAWKSLRMIVKEEAFSNDTDDNNSIKIGKDGKAIADYKSESQKKDETKVAQTTMSNQIERVESKIINTPKVETKNTKIATANTDVVKKVVIKKKEEPVVIRRVDVPNKSMPSKKQKEAEAVVVQKERTTLQTAPSTSMAELESMNINKNSNPDMTASEAMESILQKRALPKAKIEKAPTQVKVDVVPAQGKIGNVIGETTIITEDHYLPVNYTGYKVEVITSKKELTSDHPIFNDFGAVTLERFPDGTFAYLLGDFTSERIAVYFLNNTIIDSYPRAKLVQFANGKRILR